MILSPLSWAAITPSGLVVVGKKPQDAVGGKLPAIASSIVAILSHKTLSS